MRKKFIQPAVIGVVFSLFSLCAQARDLIVCAVPQAYTALESIKEIAPVSFDTYYGMPEDIEARINNNSGICSIVVSSEEKLPVLLVRANKTTSEQVKKFVKAPLILWTANETLLKNNIDVIKKKKIKSLAIPNPHFTPVGFSAHQIVSKKNFPTDYLKHRIFRTDHEFQIFSLVRSQNVQAGFLTKPLIMRNGAPLGSYWYIPEDYYTPIYYYVVNTSKKNTNRNNILFNYIYANKDALEEFDKAGFERL